MFRIDQVWMQAVSNVVHHDAAALNVQVYTSSPNALNARVNIDGYIHCIYAYIPDYRHLPLWAEHSPTSCQQPTARPLLFAGPSQTTECQGLTRQKRNPKYEAVASGSQQLILLQRTIETQYIVVPHAKHFLVLPTLQSKMQTQFQVYGLRYSLWPSMCIGFPAMWWMFSNRMI